MGCQMNLCVPEPHLVTTVVLFSWSAAADPMMHACLVMALVLVIVTPMQWLLVGLVRS